MEYKRISDWGTFLKAELKKRGMTQAVFGARAGINRNSIYQLTRRKGLSLDNMRRFSRVLGTDLTIHLTSLETQRIIQRAKEAGITGEKPKKGEHEASLKPGQGNPGSLKQEKIDSLTQENARLTAENEDLKARIAQLEAEKETHRQEIDQLKDDHREAIHQKQIEIAILETKLGMAGKN